MVRALTAATADALSSVAVAVVAEEPATAIVVLARAVSSRLLLPLRLEPRRKECGEGARQKYNRIRRPASRRAQANNPAVCAGRK